MVNTIDYNYIARHLMADSEHLATIHAASFYDEKMVG